MKSRLKYHLVYVILLLVFSSAPLWITTSPSGEIHYFNPPHSPTLMLILFLTAIFMMSMAFYPVLFFLMPRYYFKGKTGKFWVGFFVFFTINYWLAYMLYSFLFYWFVDGVFVGYIGFSFFNFQVILLFMFFGGIAFFMIRWKEQLKQHQLIRNKNINTQLKILKTQINPHFLFNTLNNIQAISKGEPQVSAASIHKLNTIMKSLEEEKYDMKQSLEMEISLLSSYIDLINLRYEYRNFIHLKIDGSSDNIKVYPMFMLPLLENAFKHGDRNATPPCISVNLSIQEKELVFEIWNKKSEKMRESDVGGSGLENMRKRLELLYPDKYSFSIINLKTEFLAKLILKYD